MQALGNFLVGHYLHNDRSVYGVFATVPICAGPGNTSMRAAW
jgi:hypothetical protein